MLHALDFVLTFGINTVTNLETTPTPLHTLSPLPPHSTPGSTRRTLRSYYRSGALFWRQRTTVSVDCLIATLFDSDRVLQFEASESLRAARDEEEGDSDDDAETLEFRRQEAGAYTQQRLAVVMVVTAAHSSAVAKRVAEKLHQVLVCVFPFVVAREGFV